MRERRMREKKVEIEKKDEGQMEKKERRKLNVVFALIRWMFYSLTSFLTLSLLR